MRVAPFVGAVLLVLFATAGVAEIYKFTDSRGGVHFVDDISKVPKKYRHQLNNTKPIREISVIDGKGTAPTRRQADDRTRTSARSYRSVNVELYMTSWCGYCRKMERFLKEKGIPYTAYDIEKDSNAATIYRDFGGSGVPVVRIGTNVVHGYNPEAVLSYIEGK